VVDNNNGGITNAGAISGELISRSGTYRCNRHATSACNIMGLTLTQPHVTNVPTKTDNNFTVGQTWRCIIVTSGGASSMVDLIIIMQITNAGAILGNQHFCQWHSHPSGAAHSNSPMPLLL